MANESRPQPPHNEDPLLALDPPHPRAAGTAPTPPPKDTEDAIVDQIAAQNATDAIDDLYEHDREHEAPMLVIGDEKRHWYHIFKRPKFWVMFISLLLVAAALAWLITPSRLWIVNTVGLRAPLNIATLVRIPQGAPPILKNAKVMVNGHEHHTNDEGKLALMLPYGPLNIEISKPGYETVTQNQLLDFDPFFYYLGGKQADDALRAQTVVMKSVGITLHFVAKDWLTGQPLTQGHFGVGDVVTTPSQKGEVDLTIPATDAKSVALTAKFGGSGYADTTVDFALAAQPAELTFVPAGKHYFISKRSGQFVVYSSNIDGTAVAEVVPGSASETGDVAFSAGPAARGILASTREATRDTFGSVQQKLYVVDLDTNKLTAADTALRFDIVDWAGDTVVYVAHYHDATGATVQRIGSINTTNAAQKTLATHPAFKVVRVRLGSAVFVAGNNELRTVKLTGGTEKTLGTGVERLVQTDANIFAYRIGGGVWRQYDVNADRVADTTTPASPNRAFLANTSQDGQTFLVADTVDGQPALLARAVGNGKETALYRGTDLTGPWRWVGNVAVYRAANADYAVSASGGAPKKITDVTSTQTAQNDYFDFN